MTQAPRLLSEIPSLYPSDIDLFVCGASFETRCLSISSHLRREAVSRVLITFNKTYSEDISRNCAALEEMWGSKASRVDVSSDDPIQSFDALLRAVSPELGSGCRRVVIDITTVTHEVVMMMVHVCSLIFTPQDRVDFIYATASDYSLGQEKSSKWLSKGVKEVRSVIGFPGRLVPSKSNHLIVFVGFEEYRALSVIREFEPSLLSIGYGDKSEPSTGPHQETNETKVRRLRSMVGAVNEFVFSCYDPFSAANTLHEIVSRNPTFNHVVAPMNTKMSTIGAARFASKNDAVQLCYSQPELYNVEEYSAPGTHFYSVELSKLIG